MEIRLAELCDLEGVLALLKANHVSNLTEEEKAFGFVTTSITKEQLAELIQKEKGVTIACDGDKVVAFAFAAPWEYWKVWPLFQHMIDILPQYELNGVPFTVENTYQYGPVCVHRSYRGTGLFKEVFDFSLATMSERFPIMVTFVNSVNPLSLAAHTRKAGMTDTGGFGFNGNNYRMLACYTER